VKACTRNGVQPTHAVIAFIREIALNELPKTNAFWDGILKKALRAMPLPVAEPKMTVPDEHQEKKKPKKKAK